MIQNVAMNTLPGNQAIPRQNTQQSNIQATQPTIFPSSMKQKRPNFKNSRERTHRSDTYNMPSLHHDTDLQRPNATHDIHEGNDTANSLEEDLLGGAHGGLEVDLANVLPLLLEKRGEEVTGELGVDDDLLLVHVNVADGDVEAHDLLHLELDGGLDLVDLLLHVILGGEEGGELAGLGKTGAEETGDLLDHVVGGEEEVVTLGKLLDELLVLVELLEVLNAHVVDADAVGLLAMDGVTEDAALEVGAGDGGELEGSGETLLTSGVVVLEGDLALDGLDEVALLALELLSGLGDGLTAGEGKDVGDSLVKEGRVKLVGHGYEVKGRMKGASTE